MFAPLQFFSIHASCLTAFFRLFRKCHVLPVSASAFDPKRQFIRSDFIFKGNVIYIHVWWRKTVQLGQHTILITLVAQTQSGLCPIASVSQALALTPKATSNTQVFCYRSSTSATLSVFTYNTFI